MLARADKNCNFSFLNITFWSRLSAKQREIELLANAEREKAAAVEAAKAEAKTPIMEEAKQEEPKPTQNGMYRITAVFELKASSKNEAVEMAKDLLNMIGVEAEIRIG